MAIFNRLTAFMTKREYILLCLFGLIAFVVYFPFILYGGFGPGDHLSLIVQSLNKFDPILDIQGRLTGGASDRPVSTIVISGVLLMFKDNPTLYIVAQLLIWFSTVFFISYILYRVIDKYTAWIFALLAVFPVFCSTIVSSPYLLAEYGLSVFFWSIAMFFLHRFVVRRRASCYFLAYLFLVLGLFSLSIILPLLIVTAIFPIIYEYKTYSYKRDNLLKLGIRYVFPVILIGFCFIIFKIYITGFYQSVYEGLYGVAPITLKSFLQAGFYFFVILFEVPLLLIEVIPSIFRPRMLFLTILVIIFFMTLRKMSRNANGVNIKTYSSSKENLFILLIVTSLIGCSTIFFISNYPSVTFGYYNKMMLPSFILFSILLSHVIKRTFGSWRVIFALAISILWISSMVIQLDNFIESWQTRKKVFIDCVDKLGKLALDNELVLIANVPNFTKNNYNNEEVFWLTWAFSSGLKIFGAEKDVNVFPVCWRTIVDKDYYPGHNIHNYVNAFSKDTNFWYYEFDNRTGLSKLEKINGRSGLEKKFQYIKENKINFHSIIHREMIRSKFKEFVQKI